MFEDTLFDNVDDDTVILILEDEQPITIAVHHSMDRPIAQYDRVENTITGETGLILSYNQLRCWVEWSTGDLTEVLTERLRLL